MRKLIIILVTLVVAILFQNCSPTHDRSDENALSTNLSVQQKTQVQSLLEQKCLSCHGNSGQGGISHINDLKFLITSYFVIPKEPDLSVIYTSVQNGSQPPSAPLSKAEVDLIYQWIKDGANTDGSTSTNTPTPTQTLGPSYSAIASLIFAPRCLSCHASGTALGGVVLDNYASVKTLVVAGNPSTSSLFNSVVSGAMPQGGAKLSPAEIQAISDWIMQGALNN